MKKEVVFCAQCETEFPAVKPNESKLRLKLDGRAKIENFYALTRFTRSSKIQKAIHLLKYGDKPKVGHQLGIAFANKITLDKSIDYIIPVPLHPIKLKNRGYNQSEEFANGISYKNTIPIINSILHKTSHTQSQASKNRNERLVFNPKAYKLDDKQKILQERHILLVDDVITTGVTLENCIAAFKDVKNIRISIAVIAFTE